MPFFDLRHGDGLHGWQFWPLVGNEHKDVTTQTNGFGDVKTIGGHDSFFVLWPFFFNDQKRDRHHQRAVAAGSIPAYSLLRSPQRDSTTVIWPFFNHVDDREKKYREWDAPVAAHRLRARRRQDHHPRLARSTAARTAPR